MSNDLEIFDNKIIDPSLLLVRGFWEDITEKYTDAYYPSGIKDVKETTLHRYYGSYRKDQMLPFEEMIALCEEHFSEFSWREYPNYLENIKESIPYFTTSENNPIQEILLDEIVFLFSKSSMLSRLKKSIKHFEIFNKIPLINLEKLVPEEYRDAVSGIKNAFSMVNYIVSVGGFTLALGFPLGTVVGLASSTIVEGVRIFIIDP